MFYESERRLQVSGAVRCCGRSSGALPLHAAVAAVELAATIEAKVIAAEFPAFYLRGLKTCKMLACVCVRSDLGMYVGATSHSNDQNEMRR